MKRRPPEIFHQTFPCTNRLRRVRNNRLSEPSHIQRFDRWLALFETTARELCCADAADYFMERARLIAQSLELGIASNHGVLLGKGERFTRALADVDPG